METGNADRILARKQFQKRSLGKNEARFVDSWGI
jgi:hypothetical protein